ncbi:MAG: hypothetical protein Q8O82_20360, partial [Pseudorhodobacter sp.]|nr:hypothetical protein [Pseudorhodobacter sp.]
RRGACSDRQAGSAPGFGRGLHEIPCRSDTIVFNRPAPGTDRLRPFCLSACRSSPITKSGPTTQKRCSDYREPTAEFIDGVVYDGRTPNAYIDGLSIGLKTGQTVAGGAIVN